MDIENLPKLTFADGTELPCSLCGKSHSGTLYVEVHGLSWREAVDIFTDPAKTQTMTYPFDGGPLTRTGYTVFCGFDVLDDGGVRFTMRRRYEGEGSV